MLANIDENMGRLDAFLRESGLRDDTIVIFLTDNGGTAGVPVFNAGLRGKQGDAVRRRASRAVLHALAGGKPGRRAIWPSRRKCRISCPRCSICAG